MDIDCYGKAEQTVNLLSERTWLMKSKIGCAAKVDTVQFPLCPPLRNKYEYGTSISLDYWVTKMLNFCGYEVEDSPLKFSFQVQVLAQMLK